MAKIESWKIEVGYVEACNCDFGCPCNFNGFPTGGFCEALVGYHIRKGHYGSTQLDGLRVVLAAAWPKAIHQGGGTARLYGSEEASPDQRDALVKIFSGQAKGNGPFAIFAETFAKVEDPVFASIEMRVDGARSGFRVPGHIDVALAPHTNPVDGEEQDVRIQMPKGFIFQLAHAFKTRAMRMLGAGVLSFDHTGRNAFVADLTFQGP